MNNKFNNTQEVAEWLSNTGLLSAAGFRTLLNGDPVGVNLEFLHRFADAYAERATTASAAPTIRTEHQLWTLVNECHAGYQYGPAERSTKAKDALAAYIDQHASARAEEARREGYRNGMEHAKALYEAGRDIAVAQRTAGGDAVKIMAETIQSQATENTQLREEVERLTIANEIATALAQPVAEAAAQADDWIHAEMADIETEAVVSLPRKELVAHYKQARADLAHWKRRALGGAPTAQPTPCPFLGSSSMTRGVGTARELRAAMEAAQPTPNENAPCLGRGVLGTEGGSTLEVHGAERDLQHVPTYAEDASLSQPTLPDDERARIQAHAVAAGFKLKNEVSCKAPDLYPYVYDFARRLLEDAALRQPGALPDDTPYCKPCGIYCATDSCPLCSRTTAPRVTLAAKQTGKEA